MAARSGRPFLLPARNAQLKIAPTVASESDKLMVHVLGPVAVIVPVFVQLEDHPPKFTPLIFGAVIVTVVPMG